MEWWRTGPPPERRRFPEVHLLHRALLVFVAEGERELRPRTSRLVPEH